MGDVKIVNNTRKAEAIIGKTTREDIEKAFGPHYKYDYTNTLTYYPDSDNDGVISMDDLSLSKAMHMYFSDSTGILSVSDFYLYDTGDFEE